MAAGEDRDAWFERHGSTPITELPAHWPEDYRALVERRIALIESDPNIGLIERPEYKRRWNVEPWEDQERAPSATGCSTAWRPSATGRARLTPQLRSATQLADRARTDADFMQVAALYAGRDDFDVAALVAELVESEAIPYLPALRYTADGLRKRAAWEETWSLQRQEDAIDARIAAATPKYADESDQDHGARLAAAQRTARDSELGDIPVPPKYKSSDFRAPPSGDCAVPSTWRRSAS